MASLGPNELKWGQRHLGHHRLCTENMFQLNLIMNGPSSRGNVLFVMLQWSMLYVLVRNLIHTFTKFVYIGRSHCDYLFNTCHWKRVCLSLTVYIRLNCYINTLNSKRNGRHFADDTSKWIFLEENICILIETSLKFVPKGPINNNPALVQKMAWRRTGDKPFSNQWWRSLLTHICVIRPQWVEVNKQLCKYLALATKMSTNIGIIIKKPCKISCMNLRYQQQVSIYHYTDVIMGTIASQITSFKIVYSTVYSDADQRKYQGSASLALCGEFTGNRWIPRTNGQ